MILVDTSVWVDHLRRDNPTLARVLLDEQVLCHPFVIGELACGSLKNRAKVVALLRQLPQAVEAAEEEVLEFLERHRLFALGLGWIDVHLLASARLSGASFWTLDRRLNRAARDLRLAT